MKKLTDKQFNKVLDWVSHFKEPATCSSVVETANMEESMKNFAKYLISEKISTPEEADMDIEKFLLKYKTGTLGSSQK